MGITKTKAIVRIILGAFLAFMVMRPMDVNASNVRKVPTTGYWSAAGK